MPRFSIFNYIKEWFRHIYHIKHSKITNRLNNLIMTRVKQKYNVFLKNLIFGLVWFLFITVPNLNLIPPSKLSFAQTETEPKFWKLKQKLWKTELVSFWFKPAGSVLSLYYTVRYILMSTVSSLFEVSIIS